MTENEYGITYTAIFCDYVKKQNTKIARTVEDWLEHDRLYDVTVHEKAVYVELSYYAYASGKTKREVFDYMERYFKRVYKVEKVEFI